MKSMTGYAFKEISKNGITVSAEIKSYNSRYLELSIHLPSWLSSVEMKIREFITRHYKRGKVELNIRVRTLSGINVKVNEYAAIAYLEEIKRLAKMLCIKEEPGLGILLNLEGVLETENEKDEEKYWVIIEHLLAEVIGDADESRKREGEHTKKDILSQLDVLDNSLKIVSNYIPELESGIKENLLSRFTELLGDKIDESRILSETAVLLMKYGISEEISRLSSHLSEFRLELERNTTSGKKLDFFSQEINREVNTIGAKTPIIEVSRAVVEMKNALENIREQLRNVE